MKKFLLQFADQVLSREDLKSIKGGSDEIVCDRTVYYPGGVEFEETGVACSGWDVDQCNGYAEDNCYVGASCGNIDCHPVV